MKIEFEQAKSHDRGQDGEPARICVDLDQTVGILRRTAHETDLIIFERLAVPVPLGYDMVLELYTSQWATAFEFISFVTGDYRCIPIARSVDRDDGVKRLVDIYATMKANIAKLQGEAA